MYQFNENYNSQGMTQAMTKSFVSTVFLWMFAALGITAATAYLFGTNESLMSLLMQVTPQGGARVSTLGWIITFAPLVIVFLMTARINKMSVTTNTI